jgi:hypothetical protein
VLFRSGDRLRSVHRLGPAERARVLAEGLRVGLIRQSGARPVATDPDSVLVPLDAAPPAGPRR